MQVRTLPLQVKAMMLRLTVEINTSELREIILDRSAALNFTWGFPIW